MKGLFLGDCMELLDSVPEGSVDMLLTDPPYGYTECSWDTVLPLEAMWEKLRRAVKPDGAMLFFACGPFDKVLACSNLKEYRYDWVWRKDRAANFFMAKLKPLRVTENILVFYRGRPKYNPQMGTGKPYLRIEPAGRRIEYTGRDTREHLSDNKGTRYPKNLLEFVCVRESETLGHPTQKPLALCEYLIRTYTAPGETVLDICAGSGTTAAAAINSGRDWIAFEKDPRWHGTAAKRIAGAEAVYGRRLIKETVCA
ncbi:MAG: site-specific DNA-methyltransferase [Deltaproteobacteria bacterium]|jgi:site-specific DNA-methyltransferase (adenine-specific)|nr:site-specific DNA-methyltransferase [Deltaproteobacteria bacterium]